VQKSARATNNREIERKFLLRGLPDKLNRSRCYIIDQGYLASEPAGRQVRLRKKGTAATLTFKVGRGRHREEREIRLSPKQFDALWPGTAGRRLRKVRCEIPWKNLVVEIDIRGDTLVSWWRKWNSRTASAAENSNRLPGSDGK
jgi:adenylate cyclase